MLFLMALVFGETQAMRTESLLSPNGDIKVDVTIADSLLFTVSKGQECIISSCVIGLQLPRQQMGVKPRLKGVKRDIIDETLHNAVPIKNADTPNKASRLTLSFQGNYDVEFRAYDHAVAYRFVLKGKGTADVMDEKMVMDFPTPFTAHLSKTKTGFWTSYEYPYSHLSTKDYGSDDEMTYLPVLLETPQGTKILLSESDVRDYPAMFLKGTARRRNGSLMATGGSWSLKSTPISPPPPPTAPCPGVSLSWATMPTSSPMRWNASWEERASWKTPTGSSRGK